MARNSFRVQVVENKEVALDTFLFKMNLLGKRISPKPGQFLEMAIDSSGLLNRPFSIHFFYDDKKHIKILFKVVGKSTEYLSQKAVGDYVNFLGPFGNGFNFKRKLSRLAIVAGGIGYAPFAFLIKELLKKKDIKTIDVFYGVTTEVEFVEFWRLKDPRLKFYLTTDDGSKWTKGFITDEFRKALDSGTEYDKVFTCGNQLMLKKVFDICSEKSIPVEGSLEKRFGCGFGACLGCSIKMKNGKMEKVCTDGPVFNLNEIDWSYFNEK